MKQTLPLAITQILTSKEWAGGWLLQLENDVSRPTANDVVMNYWWLRPVAKRFPKSVPSAFFCTDVFLYLNHHFMGQLLKVQQADETVRSLASQEAGDMKRLMGALRFLWRSSSLVALSHQSCLLLFVVRITQPIKHIGA